MSFISRGAARLGLYIFVILFPLVVAGVVPGSGAGRGFSLQFAVACGFVALAIMVFEFALILRVNAASRAFGQDSLIQFHRSMGLLAAILLLLHALLMFRHGYPLAYLNVFSEDTPWMMRWGVISVAAVLLLSVLSIFRTRLRIAYQWWQVSHMFLALVIVFTALTHIYLVGIFTETRPMRLLWSLYAAAFIALVFNFKLLKPIRMWRQPWEIVSNEPEAGESRTLTLRPVGHPGMLFSPGQFAWIITGRSPFHIDQHPISLSSCAYDELGRQVAFTIRSLGDWSGRVVPALTPGRRVWLDGPYGVLTPDREQGPGYVLIGGGVGITPLRSMCLTLAKRGDLRPVLLFYGNLDEAALTFRTDFDALQSRMNLKVIYVLERPPAGWQGETGFITAEVLKRHLPEQYKRLQYFICGPTPLMDAMEGILPSLDVPSGLIHTERFDMI